MPSVRSTIFIRVNGDVFFPRPTSVANGVMRHRWFERMTGETGYIASPDLWESLKKNNVVQRLTETSGGKGEITNE